MKRILLSMFIALALLPVQLTQPDLAFCQKVYRLALMMDGDHVNNLVGRDILIDQLNDPSFQKKWGDGGKYEWVKDAQFNIVPSAANMEKIEAAARELMERDDIDLIVTFCTVAAHSLLRHNNRRTPVFLSSKDDPIQAGLIESYENHGIPNFHFDYVAGFIQDNLGLMASYFGFHSIGIIYENSPYGRARAKLGEIEEAGKSLGLEIMTESMKDETDASCQAAIRNLSDKMPDVLFIGSQQCLDGKKLSSILQPLTAKGIPALCWGENRVRNGALGGFSLSSELRDHEDARYIVNILAGRGKPAGKRATVDLNLNLAVAAQLGYNPSYALLAAAEKLYWEIETEEYRDREKD